MYSRVIGHRTPEKDEERLLTTFSDIPGFKYPFLTADVAASATSISVNRLPTGAIADGFWVIIDPWTVQCEIRKVTAISGNTLTVAALGFAHSADDAIIYTTQPIINVKWFGAVGDSTTNDQAAIQAAVDEAPDESSIIFPEGIYYITSAISIAGKDHIWIYGPGKIKVSGAFAAFDVDDTASRATEFIYFKDLFIVGNGSTSIGIELDKTNSFGVSDIRIINCEINACLKAVHTTSAGQPIRVWVQNCRLTATNIAGSIGVHIESPDCKVMNNTIRGFDEGIQIDGASQVITGNHIYMSPSSSHDTDIAIMRGASTTGTGHLIANNYLDGDPDDAAIVLDSQGARGVTIIGNYFHTEKTGGPFIAFEHTAGGTYDVQDVTIIGNVFYGVTATKTNGVTFSNTQTDDSEKFLFYGNVWRLATAHGFTPEIRQTGTFAASFTPNPLLGGTIELTLTGNTTVQVPSAENYGGIGNRVTYHFIQDGTGGRTVAFVANYLTDWVNDGNVANARASITFEWDGTNWVQVGAQKKFDESWVDYASSSTITGWSSTTTEKIWYKKRGNIIFVRYRIEGTSDSVSTSFTLPNANGADIQVREFFRGFDNGGSPSVWAMRMTVSSSTVTFYAANDYSTAWTASGTKAIMGSFWYVIA
jgi:hypothetical protein